MNDQKKIIEYWMSLYPEFKSEDELDNLLKYTVGISLNELAKRRDEQDFFCKNEVTELIEYMFSLQEHKQLKYFEKKHKEHISQYNFFKYFINYVYVKYYDEVKKVAEGFSFDNVVLNCLEQTAEYAVKILILDINFMKKNKKLKGDSPSERYKYYENEILGDINSVKEIYYFYFEMVRVIDRIINNCCCYCIEILKNFEKDKIEIKNVLQVKNNEMLVIDKISIGSGDKHKGKSVATVFLANGEKILYKPHSLETDIKFSEFITWINSRKSDELLDLYSSEALSYEDYGWAFFISNQEVHSFEGVKRYYKRGGQLLCLLYMFNAVDCHYENIVASGEYPVLIDLETLIHPSIEGHWNKRENDGLRKKCEKYKDSTVLSVGLLPNFIVGGENDSERVDISGFSNVENSYFPFKSMQLTDLNTDEIKVVRSYKKIPMGKNCPQYKGKRYEWKDFLPEFIEGFSNMYDWIIKNKEYIEDIVLKKFSGIKVRILFRATHIYSRILATSMHPDFLGDDISRRVLLSRIGINSDENYYDIIPLEYKSLLNNDIPYFSAMTDNTMVTDDECVLERKLKEVPIANIQKKIAIFSELDKLQQIYYINMAYGMKVSNRKDEITSIKFSRQNAFHKKSERENMEKLAREIGDYLIQCSFIIDEGGVQCRNWMTSTLKKKSDELSEIVPAGYDLYNGVCGIGEFLMELGSVTRDNKYITSAVECANSVINALAKKNIEGSYSIGMYNGIAGYLLFLYDLYRCTKNMYYDKYIQMLFDILENEVVLDKSYDIVSGTAGCIAVLCYIWSDSDMYKERCKYILGKAVEHLCFNVHYLDDGSLMWKSHFDKNDYSGYAHGIAGIIAQLMNAQKIVNNDKIVQIVNAALVHERQFYNEKIHNWYISRDKKQIGNGWCHGAPGILLSKSILKENGYIDSQIDKELEETMNATIQYSFGCTLGYCHGDVGNLDIILKAARQKKDEEIVERANDTFGYIVRDEIAKRYKGKAFRGGEVVGLMLGTAGLGYSILRFLYPEKVKSILYLE